MSALTPTVSDDESSAVVVKESIGAFTPSSTTPSFPHRILRLFFLSSLPLPYLLSPLPLSLNLSSFLRPPSSISTHDIHRLYIHALTLLVPESYIRVWSEAITIHIQHP